ncbi:MAG: VTC domain-containing protein [Bacteroidetes bacterium]|nr:MAG: VTC domain-containing protein [Bacteroidota bacterium]
MARFERKFKINGIERETVVANLRVHPAGFRVLHPDRQVNNIYFDTIDLTTFHQNVAGINQRKKFRMRWYGDDVETMKKSQFEIKIKHNELGTKKVTKCGKLKFSDLSKITDLANEYSETFAPLYPTLMNAYTRSYYTSADGRFRVTIDRNLYYYSLLGQTKFYGYRVEEPGVILEVKYEEADDNLAGFVLQNLPYRHTKSSKYVNGVSLTSMF